MKGHRGAIWLAIAAAVTFGAATPASKVLLPHLSSFLLAGLLYLGAAMATAPFALGRRAWPWRMSTKNRVRLAGSVVFGGILAPLLLLTGLQLASASSVSIWLNLELAATAVLGALLFKDHVGRMGWLGIAGAVLAAGLLTREPNQAGMLPGLLVGGAAVCWGLDNNFSSLQDGLRPAESTFWKGLLAGGVNLVIGLARDGAPAGTPILEGLALGAISFGLSLTLYLGAAQRLGAIRSQVFFATAPFFGLALSIAILKDPFEPLQAGAAILMVGAIAALLLDQHKHEHSHVAMTHTHSHRHDDGHHHHDHPGLPKSTRHTHEHMHQALTHSHPHLPDLHHRHQH